MKISSYLNLVRISCPRTTSKRANTKNSIMNPFEKKTRLIVENAREDIQLLVIILDINPYIWGKRKLDQKQQPSSGIPTKTLINFSQTLSHMLLFVNAYLNSNSKSKLAVIAAHTKQRYDFQQSSK